MGKFNVILYSHALIGVDPNVLYRDPVSAIRDGIAARNYHLVDYIHTGENVMRSIVELGHINGDTFTEEDLYVQLGEYVPEDDGLTYIKVWTYVLAFLDVDTLYNDPVSAVLDAVSNNEFSLYGNISHMGYNADDLIADGVIDERVRDEWDMLLLTY